MTGPSHFLKVVVYKAGVVLDILEFAKCECPYYVKEKMLSGS